MSVEGLCKRMLNILNIAKFSGEENAFKAEPLRKAIHSRTETWEPIFTPGHAKDHMVYLNHNNGVLFSGDLFVTPKTKLVLREESVPVIIDSIKRDCFNMTSGKCFAVMLGMSLMGRRCFEKNWIIWKTSKGKFYACILKRLTVREISRSFCRIAIPLSRYLGMNGIQSIYITSDFKRKYFKCEGEWDYLIAIRLTV